MSIKFISYNGHYPNLCSGDLVIEKNGKQYVLHNIMHSGGNVRFDENWEGYIEFGEWTIDAEDLPNELKNDIQEIEKVINNNVAWGCCGGCI